MAIVISLRLENHNYSLSLEDDQALSRYGKSLQSVIGFISEDSRLPVEIPTIQALLEGRTQKLPSQSLLIAKDGTEHPISDSAALIRNDKGEVAGLVLVFQDTAERRISEQALASALAYAIASNKWNQRRQASNR